MSKTQRAIIGIILASVIAGPSALAGSPGGFAPGTRSMEKIDQATPEYDFQQLWTLILSRMGTNLLADSETNVGPLPRLARTPIPSMNAPFEEADLIGLWNANRGILGILKKDPQGREKLEALMDEEPEYAMKLLLASQAAPLGSAKGALFILNSIQDTDYYPAQNTFWAIDFLWYGYKTNAPDWLMGMTELALADDRPVNVRNTSFAGNSFTMSWLADEDAELALILGNSHHTNATPFLIEMARKTNGRRGPVMALGELGDPRAIPLLIEFVKQKGPSTTLEPGEVLDDDFLRPVESLGNLHATEAVPVLLEYIQFPDVIEALQSIGDERAIVPLQNMVLSNGVIKKPGVSNDPELTQERVASARIAIATLDHVNRTKKLCELLTDPTFDQYQRRSVVWALGDEPDPRAIPFLAKAIKTDPSGAVVNQAITVMAAFKYKVAVEALIDSFDANFDRKRDWKRAYNPGMFQDNIADSLRTLTGQQFASNKDQWSQWWKENQATVLDLK
jgi:HEAT repeat protein